MLASVPRVVPCISQRAASFTNIGTLGAMGAWRRTASRSNRPRSPPFFPKFSSPNAPDPSPIGSGWPEPGSADSSAVSLEAPTSSRCGGSRTATLWPRCCARSHAAARWATRGCEATPTVIAQPSSNSWRCPSPMRRGHPRLLGAVTAIEPPSWLGSTPLVRRRLIEAQLLWPDGATKRTTPGVAGTPAGRFQVFDGGLRKEPEVRQIFLASTSKFFDRPMVAENAAIPNRDTGTSC